MLTMTKRSDVGDRKRVKHKMDHLVCFVPAMLALGSHTGAVSSSKADQYMQLAENLTETCWQFYAVQPTGQLPLLFQYQSSRLYVSSQPSVLQPSAASQQCELTGRAAA